MTTKHDMRRIAKSGLFIAYFLSTLVFLVSCDRRKADPVPEKQVLTILYTNDEHGWMEPFDELAGGASGMLGRWIDNEGYDPVDNYLVLSGGDMWTGPALSSWFKGASMVEVMNTMGYDAAAIGNHEFDFMVEVLESNLASMNFPLLSANIRYKNTDDIPGFARPYLIKKVGDVEVGIIGLSSISTPWSAFPAYVEQFEFIDYESAIETYAPIVWDEGADILLIIGHICEDEMLELIPVAKKYDVSLIGGGHCHQIIAREMEGIALVQAASYLAAYAKVEIEIIPGTKNAGLISYRLVFNEKGFSDQSVDDVIAYWKSEADDELAEIIGYCSSPLDRSSVEMSNMVVDSWFYRFPNADVSITNAGGIRQNITQGNITVETVVGLLPFTNLIYELDLTGAELIDCLDNYLIGGMTTINGYTFLNGSEVHADSTYTVLTTDYLYSLTSNNMSTYDPEPYQTSVSYRQPLIDWMRSLNTSAQDPLENYLDPEPRR